MVTAGIPVILAGAEAEASHIICTFVIDEGGTDREVRYRLNAPQASHLCGQLRNAWIRHWIANAEALQPPLPTAAEMEGILSGA